MKAKHLVSMLLAGSMILGLTACAPTTNSGGGNDSPQPTGTDSGSGGASSEYLVYNVGEEPKTWDPQLNTSSMGGHVILNLYDGLVRDTRDGVQMASAERYELSANADGVEDTVYTFYLRDGLTWSDGEPVTAHDLHAEGAMTALLKDALKPNLVQTLEGTPAFVHGGPFANIAHGCNSIMATHMAMALGDYAVTEAGFGADLGAEKFLDIKCRLAGLKPDAVVVVATVRALKNHGGVAKADLNEENLEALEAGLPNLLQHVENITKVYNLPCVVAINAFPTDTKAEVELVERKCKELGVNVALSQVWAKGGEGGLALADEVVRLCAEGDEQGRSAETFQFAYGDELSLKEKIEAIAKRVYHADGVNFEPAASKEIAKLESLGFGGMPVCMAKTQYSFSDDQTKLGAPRGFTITVRQVKVSAGAGFVVALTGSIMTMPGLGKTPAAFKIDVDETGKISGLF